MYDVEVLESPDRALAALDPTRARLLAELATPGSATSLAAKLGLPRQRINYHLRALEAAGLVTLQEERQRRGLTERILVASAGAYVVSPGALGAAGVDPSRVDRLSVRYLIALAARLIREIGELSASAERAEKSLPTLALDTEIRFATPEARASFARELSEAVTDLVARHHDQSAPGGRWHRLLVAAHPHPDPTLDQPTSTTQSPDPEDPS